MPTTTSQLHNPVNGPSGDRIASLGQPYVEQRGRVTVTSVQETGRALTSVAPSTAQVPPPRGLQSCRYWCLGVLQCAAARRAQATREWDHGAMAAAAAATSAIFPRLTREQRTGNCHGQRQRFCQSRNGGVRLAPGPPQRLIHHVRQGFGSCGQSLIQYGLGPMGPHRLLCPPPPAAAPAAVHHTSLHPPASCSGHAASLQHGF